MDYSASATKKDYLTSWVSRRFLHYNHRRLEQYVVCAQQLVTVYIPSLYLDIHNNLILLNIILHPAPSLAPGYYTQASGSGDWWRCLLANWTESQHNIISGSLITKYGDINNKQERFVINLLEKSHQKFSSFSVLCYISGFHLISWKPRILIK